MPDYHGTMNTHLFCVAFEPTCELPGFRGCAPRRRGSGQANKAERIGPACRGDSWSDLAWERGENLPLISSKSKITILLILLSGLKVK